MPELPEVEFGRRVADRVAKGRVISAVWTAKDDIVFADGCRRRVARALVDERVVAVRRRGKHLWFELESRPWPVFHFGMTGAFVVPGEAPLELESSGRPDETWPPRFAKIRLHFDDGGELVMTNRRRLGRIRLQHDPEREPPISALGWDPLTDRLAPDRVAERFRRRSGPLKAALLDQSAFAGVGNWIADEVAYQAALDPRRPASSLSDDEVRRLCRTIRRVVKKAVDVDADKRRFPRTWLFHYRWGGGRRAGTATARGEAITYETVAGRATAWVPARQR